MSDSLYDLLAAHRVAEYATAAGTRMHERLRGVVIDGKQSRGDTELVKLISARPDLSEYFSPQSRTEIPIAGTINGKFISRRIDRMLVDDTKKLIKILDYKTDVERTVRRSKYAAQLREYCDLLHKIYPDYKVSAAILWTHDWTLESL